MINSTQALNKNVLPVKNVFKLLELQYSQTNFKLIWYFGYRIVSNEDSYFSPDLVVNVSLFDGCPRE